MGSHLVSFSSLESRVDNFVNGRLVSYFHLCGQVYWLLDLRSSYQNVTGTGSNWLLHWCPLSFVVIGVMSVNFVRADWS
jgi:hypothetical protein